MMQPAQHGLRDDSNADRQAMTVCRLRDLILGMWNARAQARVRPSVVVVSHPFGQGGPEMPFIQQDQPIQTLATHAADHPLAKCIRLGRLWWGLQNPQSEAMCQLLIEVRRENRVPIMDDKRVRRLARECFPKLLQSPFSGWMKGRFEMQNPEAADFYDYEHTSWNVAVATMKKSHAMIAFA